MMTTNLKYCFLFADKIWYLYKLKSMGDRK